MRQIVWIIVLSLFALASALAQPQIGGVVNSADSARKPPNANGKPIGHNVIAQGSIFSLFGTGVGPATAVTPSAFPLPTTLPDPNGTSVAITGGGMTVKAFLIFTRQDQVNAILPSNTPVGNANVTVSYNGKTSPSFAISVVPSRLGIFTVNSAGTGSVAAQHGADSSYVLLTHAINPGETVVLYGTGLGPVSGPDDVAPGNVQVGSNVTVNIAGTIIKPDYAGRSPSFAGEDQINFKVPAKIALGCYIPAEVTVGGQASNAFVLPIASGPACVHPYGLGSDALARLDAGKTVNTGVFLMLTAVLDNVAAQGAGGIFLESDANAAFQLFEKIMVSFGGYSYPVAAGSCAVQDIIEPAAGFTIPVLGTLGPELNAGFALSLDGTNGKSNGITRATDGTTGKENGGYLTTFFDTLGKGTWTLSGLGGADVGAFSGKTDLPDNLVWSNVGNLSNPPRGDITFTWTGGSLNSGSLITIFGSSFVINPADPTKTRGKQFYCNAPASSGLFKVPAAVVSQLPSSKVDSASGEVAFAQLGIYSGSGSTFTVPLVKGAKFDGAYLAYGEAQTIEVKFQ